MGAGETTQTRLSLGTWKFENVESKELWGLNVMGCLSMISGVIPSNEVGSHAKLY